jgi:hypothetical protein
VHHLQRRIDIRHSRTLRLGIGEICATQGDVVVVAIASKVVKLGFPFPSERSVVGEELVESITLANSAFARTDSVRPGFRHDGPSGKAALGTARRET